ncbi:hypothetical protein [Actinomyces vulturis]|uniref:hypothetical protein n=1 Tax=Actinomyces vulturis TaxID=1857645 RepID=UPI000833109A|nr:hypothetical protein [Actinomyces vulturis]
MSDSWVPPTNDSEFSTPRFGAYGSQPSGSQVSQPNPSVSSDPGGFDQPAQGYVSPEQTVPMPGQQQPVSFSYAPKPGIIPLRPLGVFEIIDGAFQALRVNPKTMFLMSLVTMTIIASISALLSWIVLRQMPSLVSLFDGTASDEDLLASTQVSLTSNISSISSSLLGALATAIITGLLIVAVSRAVLGRIATTSQVWERTKPRIWAIIGLAILMNAVYFLISAAIFAGVIGLIFTGVSMDHPSTGIIVALVLIGIAWTVAWIIVAIFLYVRWSVSPAALVLENLSVFASLKRSWALSKGSFWHIFGVQVITMLIVGTLSGIMGGLVGGALALGMMFSPEHTTLLIVIETFLTNLISAITIPFAAATVALIYVNLRMRREGFDANLRQAAAEL